MQRQLGVNQKGVIRAMLSRNGTWYAGCGWLYDTHSGTTRIMESLVKRGDARKEEIREGSGEYMYTLTEKWLSAKV